MDVHTIFSTVRGPYKSVDRLVLREDLSQGQRVRRFAITFDSGGTTPPSAPAVNGTSVGNRRVVFMAAPASVTVITLQVWTAASGEGGNQPSTLKPILSTIDVVAASACGV